jgi:hypothetical protein
MTVDLDKLEHEARAHQLADMDAMRVRTVDVLEMVRRLKQVDAMLKGWRHAVEATKP